MESEHSLTPLVGKCQFAAVHAVTTLGGSALCQSRGEVAGGNQGLVVAPQGPEGGPVPEPCPCWVFSGNNRTAAPVTLPIEEVLQTLRDLIAYFQPPEEEMQHEDKQNKLRSLKNRQNLFKEEVRPKKLKVKILFVSTAQISLGPH